MIQQTSQTVWGYGRGMARTVARVTYAPGEETPDPTNPDFYTTLGPMKFTRGETAGWWNVDLDVGGVTYYRYLAARIIYSGGAVLQANVRVDPATPDGSRLIVQILNPAGGGGPTPPPDTPEDLGVNAALCIEAIVNQPGEPIFATGPALLAAPPPPPPPPPPSPRSSDEPTTRVL